MRPAILSLTLGCFLALSSVPAWAAEFRRVAGVKSQGVIIPAETAKKEAIGYWYTRFWTPTDREIQDLEMRLPTFLKEEAKRRSQDRDKNDPVEVGRNLKDSARQYIGVFWRGRKFIFVNGFPLHERFDWTRQFVLVSDGGSAFWSILYDVEQKTCEQLSVNGVA